MASTRARALRRLGDALRRGDERDAEEPFSARPECRAGHDDDALLLQQPLGEDRARHAFRQRIQRYIVACGTSHGKPASRNAFTAASRRSLKTATLPRNELSQLSSAATPAA